MEKINYRNFSNCFRLFNDEIEAIVTTDFGPRIIKFSFIDEENILGEHLDAAVKTDLGEWKPYGGHRLWIAPENMPNSYTPDNSPVEFEIKNDFSIRLIQPFEPITQTRKEITVTLEKEKNELIIDHKITNRGEESIEISAWALTIMKGGGICEIPNEPFASYGAENLLPVRNLTCWSYTDFTDSRWEFGKNSIRLKVDESKGEPQKIGALNKQGWAAYNWENLRFTKSFQFIDEAIYPDLNSNTEIYTAGSFVELESLSPLQKIDSGQFVEHRETWKIEKVL
jgi:hypothetical protein